MIDPNLALPGRSQAMPISGVHYVNGNPITLPVADGLATLVVGMGCFWGAERLFWKLKGVFATAVGYAGGVTPNPSYEETCSGQTGHTEVVLVIYDPKEISLDALLTVFWEGHDPTQGMRQGNDRGTQYRSAIFYTSEAESELIQDSKERFQQALNKADYGDITTEIKPLDAFYYAEEYHQQYLGKNPNGYCGMGGTGVCL